MKTRIIVYSLLLFFALQVGCCVMPTHTWYDLPTPDQVEQKSITAVCGNSELLVYLDAWVREAARRYDHFILIVVHGETLNRELYAFADLGPPEPIRVVVARLRAQFGEDRRIVLVVCNEDGLTVPLPNVSYAKDSVWARPDSFVGRYEHKRRDKEDDGIGDIFEFVENP